MVKWDTFISAIYCDFVYMPSLIHLQSPYVALPILQPGNTNWYAREWISIQCDPCGRGLDFVDSTSEVTFSCKFILWCRPVTELGIWCQHKLFRDHMGHPVDVLIRKTYTSWNFSPTIWVLEVVLSAEAFSKKEITLLFSRLLPAIYCWNLHRRWGRCHVRGNYS